MDETRARLKVFGVAVTDAEAEVARLEETAAALSADGDAKQVASLLKDTSDLVRELNARWRDVSERVFQIEERLLTATAAAAEKLA